MVGVCLVEKLVEDETDVGVNKRSWLAAWLVISARLQWASEWHVDAILTVR